MVLIPKGLDVEVPICKIFNWLLINHLSEGVLIKKSHIGNVWLGSARYLLGLENR